VYKLYIKAFRAVIVAMENPITIAYYECVLALVIRYAMRLRLIVICGLPGCTSFSSQFVIKGKIFGKKSC
jgi:hypothetical protein